MTENIISNFPETFDVYVEGFGGGASVLFSKPKSSLEVYNDLGKNVYSLFKILSDREQFLRLHDRMQLTYYHAAIREEGKSELLKNDLTTFDRAYWFLVVNRSSFNGVGGFSTTMIVRRSMSKSVSDFLSMIDKLPEIHDRLSQVVIENRDIFDLIEKYDRENAFFYLDPPYVKSTRSSSTTYEEEMSNADHLKLIEVVSNSKSKFLISGYDHEIYRNLKFDKIEFRSPNSNSDRTECLWKNY